jgi:hypothetical protein
MRGTLRVKINAYNFSCHVFDQPPPI